MSTDTQETLRLSPGLVLRRSALPFFLFGAVLMSLMFLSWMLLLPRFTKIDIGGTAFGIDELMSHREELQKDLEVAEQERSLHLLAVGDKTYQALMQEKLSHTSFSSLKVDILRIADESAEQNDAIHVSNFSYEPVPGTFKVEGDVRFVGPRSMTVLAQFIENVQAHASVASITMPRFVREDHPGMGPHSPFSITVTLK